MNRILASALSFLNALIAVLIIIGGASAGFFGFGLSTIGLVIGAFTGLVVAALVCGAIAFLAMIERHLATIARQPGSRLVHESLQTSARRDPVI